MIRRSPICLLWIWLLPPMACFSQTTYDFDSLETEHLINLEKQRPPYPHPDSVQVFHTPPIPVNLDQLKGLIGYPMAAKERGIEGTVQLRVLFDEKGNYVRHVVVNDPSPILTRAVEAHVSKLIYVPPSRDERPVAAWVDIPFQFMLLR
ncbi:MAG: energy transducer TonB [Bacteroidia bacterium]